MSAIAVTPHEPGHASRMEFPDREFWVQFNSGADRVGSVHVWAQTPSGAVRVAAQLRNGFFSSALSEESNEDRKRVLL